MDLEAVFTKREEKPLIVRCAYGGHKFNERTSQSGAALFCSQKHQELYEAEFGKDSVSVQRVEGIEYQL